MKTYQTLRLAAALLLASTSGAAAQATLAHGSTSATNVAGTYTSLSATDGTPITVASNDDANSAAQNIGFSFTYNGLAFTQFVLNTNGLVRLGSAAPSAANMFGQYEGGTSVGVEPVASTNPADVNLLMPFNFDLQAGTAGAEYRVFTTGAAGSRVCTIQWKNVSDKTDASPSQYANFSFQLKLYETSNTIEFVYGPATAGSGVAGPRFPTVGIKGSAGQGGQDVLASKNSSLNAWSTTVFITGQYQHNGSTHNFRSNMPPDVGRTYRFTTCSPLTVTNFPYTENFDAISAATSVADYDDTTYPDGFPPNSPLPCGASTLDANKDNNPWFVAADGGSTTPNALAYFYSPDIAKAADDWYFTPGLVMRVGYTYQLQFKYEVGDAAFPEGLEVKYGTSATPAGQTTTLFSNANLVNDTYATTTTGNVISITPTVTGTYYIGFHAISAANAFALLVDDMSVTENKVLGVKNATNALFSAEASPVPFGSSLTLSLNTRQAGPLTLTLRDALGRVLRQRTASASVGSSTIAVPDVASLPTGIYFLEVTQAGQKQLLRVSHE